RLRGGARPAAVALPYDGEPAHALCRGTAGRAERGHRRDQRQGRRQRPGGEVFDSRGEAAERGAAAAEEVIPTGRARRRLPTLNTVASPGYGFQLLPTLATEHPQHRAHPPAMIVIG